MRRLFARLRPRAYARPVTPTERAEEHSDVERSRQAPAQAAHALHPAVRMQALAATIGNRSLARFVAGMREGEGILDGGVVHPQVEAAIGAFRGAGRPLDSDTAGRLGPAVG